MTRKRYLNVSIPEELAIEVDDIIKKSKLGYDSRAGLIMEAVRDKIYKENRLNAEEIRNLVFDRTITKFYRGGECSISRAIDGKATWIVVSACC